jgi:hypothetical protein
VKRGRRVLLGILLCSCVGHGEGGAGEGGIPAEPSRLRFMDRSDPLVEHTFEILEVRAWHSEMRETERARGLRVCEEGENGTHWKENNCNWCWCQWGVKGCNKKGCAPPEVSARLRAEVKRNAEERAERYRKVREIQRARGMRVCEEGEHGTRWPEGAETCWCNTGIRYCTEPGSSLRAPPPIWPNVSSPDVDVDRAFEYPPRDYREIYESMGSIGRRRCKEDEIGTNWRWGCNSCWCAGGFRVCSKADCPSSYQPNGAAATATDTDTE